MPSTAPQINQSIVEVITSLSNAHGSVIINANATNRTAIIQTAGEESEIRGRMFWTYYPDHVAFRANSEAGGRRVPARAAIVADDTTTSANIRAALLVLLDELERDYSEAD